MELFLVYEFVYHDFDDDRNEEIEFHGLYTDRELASKIANKRVKYGLKNFNVIIDPDITDKTNLFKNRDTVSIYRDEENLDLPVYDITIKKLKLEGRNKNEQSNINGKIN